MILHSVSTVGAAFLLVGLTVLEAQAQEVRITAKDGSIAVTGVLLSAENGRLRVRTEIGDIDVAAEQVNCEGEGCPKAREFAYEFSVAGPGEVASVLIPTLLEGFAAESDAETLLLGADGAPVEEAVFSAGLDQTAAMPVQMIDLEGEELGYFGVRRAGASAAFDLLASGQVAMVMVEGTAPPAAVQLVAAQGGGNLASPEQERVVGFDGLAVVAHPDNGIASLTVAQVAGVLAGRITNWQQIGGPDLPISIYSQPPRASVSADIDNLILGPEDSSLAAAAKILPSSGEIAAAVTADPGGFAVVAYNSMRGTRPIPLANECGMVIAATPFSIKTEEYPLDKRITAYSRADISGLAVDFLAQLDRPTLDGLVSKAGFIDLGIEPAAAEYNDARLAAIQRANVEPAGRATAVAMADVVGRTERLSATFRFSAKSTELDNRAIRDLARVAQFIGSHKPAAVYVVGFADAGGSFNANLLLSQARARQVADQLAATAAAGELDGVTVEVRAYSELAPIACNDSPAGRAMNRRVEIWVAR